MHIDPEARKLSEIMNGEELAKLMDEGKVIATSDDEETLKKLKSDLIEKAGYTEL